MSLYRFSPSKHSFQPLRYATDLTSRHYISSGRPIGPCLENPMNTRNTVFWSSERETEAQVNMLVLFALFSLSLEKREGFPAWTCISALNCRPAPSRLLCHSRRIRYWSHFAAVYASKILKNPESLGHYLHVCIHGARNRSSRVDIGVCATSRLTRCKGRNYTKKNKDFK